MFAFFTGEPDRRNEAVNELCQRASKHFETYRQSPSFLLFLFFDFFVDIVDKRVKTLKIQGFRVNGVVNEPVNEASTVTLYHPSGSSTVPSLP